MMNSKMKMSVAALSLSFMSMAQAADDKTPKDPEDYEFRVERVVRLSGSLTRDSAIEIIQKMKYLDKNNPDKRDITFIINSGGGDVEQGFAIYDTMRTLKSDVKTVCEGRAQSMAAFLLSVGTPGKRFSLPNCRMMFHQISASNSGKFTQMEIQHSEFAALNERMMDGLSRHLNRDKKDITKVFVQDYFVSGDKAVELGAIDAVIPPLRAALPEGARPLKLE